MAKVKYPKITVKVIGKDGNAFRILGEVTRAMRKAGVKEKNIKAYVKEACAKDYDYLLSTTMKWVKLK